MTDPDPDTNHPRPPATGAPGDSPEPPQAMARALRQARRLLAGKPPPEPGKPCLLVLEVGLPPRWAPLRPPQCRIGRLPELDIVLDDTEASRHHADLTFDGEFWTVTDAGSRNGIYIHGKRVERRCLVSGDLLRIGRVHLLFVDGKLPPT
ncbi:MAG: FHA domain-containing protein [Lentisphaeria bacterium]|nr:FHA domain-containing protein [Lentisphaeria bacterium]